MPLEIERGRRSAELNTDPRAVRSRATILAAGGRLLAKGGMEAVTHQAVAAEAGVSRATIYRHWARPLDLLLATLENTTAPIFDLGDGEVQDELLASLKARLSWFNQPVAGVALGAVISRGDFEPEIDALRKRTFTMGTDLLAAQLTAAAREGTLRADVPAHTVATMIIGSVLFERHLLGTQLTAEILERIVSTALRFWQAGTPGTGMDRAGAARRNQPA
jgi:AcrR family transcriptional regulator